MNHISIYRFVSNQFYTYVRNPKDSAYESLAVQLGTSSSLWPNIVSENLSTGNNSRWIWETDPISDIGAKKGLIRYFGRAATVEKAIPMAAGEADTMSITIPFMVIATADNAFRGRLLLQAGASKPFIFDIPGGNLALKTGLAEVSPPYNWQNVRVFSNEITVALAETPQDLSFILEIEGINYISQGNTPETNPAGIVFLLEIYNLPENLEIENEIPFPLFNINNNND